MKLYMILLTRDIEAYPHYGEPTNCFLDYGSAYATFQTLPSWSQGPGFGPQYAYFLVLYDVAANGEMLPTELEKK